MLAESDDIDGDHWRSVRAALERRALAQLAQASHCAIAQVGNVRGPSDPQRLVAIIAGVGLFLRGCSLAERIALELEIAHGNLPIVAPRRQRVGGAYGRNRTLRTRCVVMSRVLGEQVSERRYCDLVGDAFDKVRAAMEIAGVLA